MVLVLICIYSFFVYLCFQATVSLSYYSVLRMAHGWDSYFHNPPPLPSDPGTLRRTSESDGCLSHHIEDFTGHHGFASAGASHEAPVFNSDFNTNYCSDPSVVNSRSDYVYQRYCGETQWQADGEQMGKDYLQRCENGNIPDFAADGLQTSDSFPSSFGTDFQGLKEDYEMPSTSFLENYSDVSSCSDADAGETRPPCKFMASKSYSNPKTDGSEKQGSSSWFFTHMDNMTFPTESLCSDMSETDVLLSSNLKARQNIVQSPEDSLEKLEKTVTSYTGHHQSSTTSYMKTTTKSKTELEISEYGGFQDEKQRKDVEGDLAHTHSDLLISGHENFGHGIDEYPDDSEEKQITSASPNIISTLKYDQVPINENGSQKDMKELLNQEKAGLNHPNSADGQNGNMGQDVQNNDEVFEGETRESDLLENKISDEHKSQIPKSNRGQLENKDSDCQKKEIQTDAIKSSKASNSNASTQQLWKCTRTSHDVKSKLLSTQKSDESVAGEVFRNLDEHSEDLLSDVSISGLSEPSLMLKSCSNNIHLNVDEVQAIAGEKSNIEISPDPECSGRTDTKDYLCMDTKDENKQGAGVHVGSCLKLNSLSQGANAHVDTELSSAAEKTNMTFSSDSNCSHLSASNEGLSTNTNDLNKDSVATHPDSSLQLQTPGTDTHPSLEMEDTSQSEKKNPTSLPDQDHSDLNITRDSLSIDITDKDRQGVDHHSESCLEPESLNTDTHSCQERTFKTSLETTSVSSPDQDCSGSSVTVDTSNKNLSHSESPFKQKSLNTDVQTSVEMEFKSQSEKKNPTSPLDQDCSSPSATCKSPFVDAVGKNKGSVAANPESSLQLEYLNTDTHPPLEGSNESPTSPPDVDCNCPNITSDSLSVNNTDKNKQSVPSISQSCLSTDTCPSKKMEIKTSSPDQNCGNTTVTGDGISIDTSDENKQSVAANPDSSPLKESSNTDTHGCVENECISPADKARATSSTDYESNSHVVTSDCNKQSPNSLESCLQSKPSSSNTNFSDWESSEVNAKTTCSLDQQQSLRESPVGQEPLGLGEDWSENARDSFEDMDISTEEQPDMLYGEPLSRDDSSCDTNESQYKEAFVTETDGKNMDHSGGQAPQLKSAAEMRKMLQPVVILKSLESENGTSDSYYCADCKHTTYSTDQSIEHYHCCHSVNNFDFCKSCSLYLVKNEQAGKHLCGDLKDGSQRPSDPSPQKKGNRQGNHRCNRCRLTFSKVMHYIKHMRTHTGKTPFRCNDCGSYFAQGGSLQRHKRVPGRCKQSNLPAKNPDVAVRQTDTPKQKDGVQSNIDMPKCFVKLFDISQTNLCGLCGKTFPTAEKVKKHLYKVHHGKGTVVSLNQSTTAVSESDEKQEKTQEVENDIIGKYKCPLCPRLFKYSYNRARHLRDCVRDAIYGGKEKIAGKYRCPLCHTMFTMTSNRYRHIKTSCLREFLNQLAKEKAKERTKVEKETVEREQKTQMVEKEQKMQTREKEKKKQPPSALTTSRSVPRYKCNLCPAVFCYASGKYRHMKKHELFKLTGKIIRYRNSIFSTKSNPETLNGTQNEDGKENLNSAEAKSNLNCRFCGKYFSSSQSLKKHERNHRGERPYRCLECGKGFKKRSHLIAHKIIHQRRIQCTVCKKILPTIGELIQHRSSHLRRGTLQCPDCTMQFQHPAHLLRHLKTHKNRENRALGLEEGTESNHQQTLESVEEEDEPKQMQCSLCKEVFDDAQVLRKHCLTHISGSSSNQCPFCKRNFSNRRYLLRHMIKHTGDKPFSCANCGKQFYRNICLKIHSQKCSPPETRTLESETKTKTLYPCPYCPRKFSKKDRWKNHQHAHKINSVHPCSRCGQYYGPNKMKQHQRNCEETTELSTGLSHDTNYNKSSLPTNQDTPKMSTQPNATTLLQFKCPYCTRRFRFRSLFLRHLVSHTGVQPYACMHCGQRYRSKTLCLQHEAFCDGVNKDALSKLKSTAATKPPNIPSAIEAEPKPNAHGETEYKCKFCTKTFMKPRYLRRHILTHNEVKPYRCKACDSCFSRYDHLKVHQTRCKGKKTRLEVRIPKISLEDVGKGWQNKFGIESAKKQEMFECKVCSRSYTTQSKLSRHFTMFHATKLFKCTRCGSSFAHEKSLKKHKKMRRCRKVLRETAAALLQGTCPPAENMPGSLDGIRSQMLKRIQPCFNKKYKYVCSYCPRVFGNSWQLGVHTRLHTGEKPYSCDYCGERFIRKDYVQRHFPKCPKKHQTSTVLCDLCGGFFPASKLENHKKGCGLTTSSSPVFQSQQSATHDPPKGFSCAYCSSRFLLFSQLQEHFLSTHKLETMTHPVSTAPLQQLLSGIKEEPVDESCDERLSDNLTQSLNTAINTEPSKQFFCQQCNMFFANKAGLTGHLRTHAVGHPFNCKSCNKGFWNKSLLRNHYRKCRNGRIPNQQLETPLKANFDFALNHSALAFGGGSTMTSTGLFRNDDLMDESTKNSEGNEVQSSSSKEKKAVQYQCSECEMSFTDGLVLISHLEDHGRQEQEKKRNTCPKCGRVCTSQGNLEKHMRMHTGDQKFPCFDCSKLFYTRSDLEAHRTCHDLSRPYACKLCNQRFWTRPSLCSHYREDHEDDVFSCRFCSKSYAVKKSLARHYRNWHPKQYKDIKAAVREKSSSEQHSSSQVSTAGDSEEDENNGSEDSDSDSAPYFPCHVCGKTFPTSESLEDHQLCHLGEKPHECEQCGKCFFQASQLQQHHRMHKSEFQCQTCGRGFMSLFALRNHKHSHGKSRSHRCSKCHLFFNGPLQLAEHMSTHREENFPCDICNRVFLSKSSRAEHWKTHSTSSDHPSPSVSRGEREQPASRSESSFVFTSELKYRCGVCSERFRDPEELSEHGCMEAKERPYSCTECNKHFLHASHLKKHRNTHQQLQSNRIYSCNQCNSSFASSQLFLTHLKSHIGIVAEIKQELDDEDGEPSHVFKCPVCSQCFPCAMDLFHHFPTHPDGTIEKIKFASGSKLKEHEQYKLTSAAEYECTECEQGFLGEAAFRQHKCSGQQQATKTECSNPSSKKSSPSYFQAAGEDEEEEEVDVTGDDLYNCLVCSMRFTSKNVLLEHQNKEHPNEKPFTCELCGKTFARKRYLKEHERRHRQKAQNETQAENKFKCSQCECKFTTAQELSLHMRKHAEKDVGEYRCDMCYKSFSQWSLLKQHQESHVGEVVYECTECDKAFAFPHLLEEHQQTHAGSTE